MMKAYFTTIITLEIKDMEYATLPSVFFSLLTSTHIHSIESWMVGICSQISIEKFVNGISLYARFNRKICYVSIFHAEDLW